MKSKVIMAVALILVTAAYTARVANVNKNSWFPQTVEYGVNDVVQIEADFFDDDSEKMNGYSVAISGIELLTADAFVAKYCVKDMGDIAPDDHIFLIRAVFKNDANSYGKGAGINLHQYIFQESSYICFPAREIYETVNGFDTMTFSLKEHSEKEIIIPYEINSDYIDISRIENCDPKLVVSLYPHKKTIRLKEE